MFFGAYKVIDANIVISANKENSPFLMSFNSDFNDKSYLLNFQIIAGLKDKLETIFLNTFILHFYNFSINFMDILPRLEISLESIYNNRVNI